MIFLDTHIVVWLYAGLVEQIENNDLFICQMVRLEMQYLYEINRIIATPEAIINDLGISIGLKVSSMNPENVFNTAMSYAWTRDVFDRLITAEAAVHNAGLITKIKLSLPITKKRFGNMVVGMFLLLAS